MKEYQQKIRFEFSVDSRRLLTRISSGILFGTSISNAEEFAPNGAILQLEGKPELHRQAWQRACTRMLRHLYAWSHDVMQQEDGTISMEIPFGRVPLQPLCEDLLDAYTLKELGAHIVPDSQPLLSALREALL